jgi:hypothetical protein
MLKLTLLCVRASAPGPWLFDFLMDSVHGLYQIPHLIGLGYPEHVHATKAHCETVVYEPLTMTLQEINTSGTKNIS